MGREKTNYYATLGSNSSQTGGARIGFRSYKDIYDGIKGSLGVVAVSQKGSGFLLYGSAGEVLPRLSLKLSGKNLLPNQLTNAAQTDGTAQVRVFCDPFSLEKAFKELVGKLQGPRNRRRQDSEAPGLYLMIGAVSQLQDELSPQQRQFMAQLLADQDVHPDDVEIELVEVEQAVEGVELILPPGCRTIREMHDRIEQRLIWVPTDAAEPH